MIIVFLTALFCNLASLSIPALVVKDGLKKLFTNPAFVFGDFVLVPIYFVVVANHFSKISFDRIGTGELIVSLGGGVSGSYLEWHKI